MLNTVLALLLLLQATAARPGVVTGQLQTKEGTPAAAIRITAVPAPPPNILPSDGQNYYSTAAPAATGLTDAQGRYRLANLAPGRYFIIARVFGYATFYPASTTADRATVVTVGADAPADGINFTVLMPPGGRVSGRVNTPPTPGARETAVLSGVDLGELLETPVGADGTFSFGHLPKGSYLLSLFPTPPGMPSRPFRVEETDARVDLVRPTLHTVSGRIAVPSGPLPQMLLGFATATSYVTVPVNPDGTFRAELQSARHEIVVAGAPAGAGYSLKSVRLGTQDVSQGLTVGTGNVTGLVITVAPHVGFSRLRGKVSGVPANVSSARVELAGRSITPYEAPLHKDGSFEFAAIPPGTYRLRVPQVPSISPSYVVVGSSDTEVEIK